jgi:hypothetical protein
MVLNFCCFFFCCWHFWPDVFVGFFSFLKAGGGAFLEEEKLYKLPTYLLIKIGKQQTINF